MKINTTDKRTQILETAKMLAATRGFNAFSHRELAELIGIKSSSVHYYFSTKEAIGIALIEAYQAQIETFFISIESLSVVEKVDKFCSLFFETAQTQQQICLGGMFASDFITLGDALQKKVKTFFLFVEGWLIKQAQIAGLTNQKAELFGRVAIATLEGASLIARLYNQPERILSVKQELIKQLES